MSTAEQQAIVKVKVYPGADGEFTIYRDDGMTYDYEKGAFEITKLHWNDAAGKLLTEGAKVWNGDNVVEIVGKN
jgi:hypothetical protein